MTIDSIKELKVPIPVDVTFLDERSSETLQPVHLNDIGHSFAIFGHTLIDPINQPIYRTNVNMLS